MTHTWQAVINQMPPHRRYIELFLGAGAVLRRKRPAAAQIGVELDPAVCARWHAGAYSPTPPHLSVIRADALEFLFDRDFQPLDLIYADPPRLPEQRRARGAFSRWTRSRHTKLLQELLHARCLVMISGPDCELYDAALLTPAPGRRLWRKVVLCPARCAGRRGGRAPECLWMNFPEPAELHDYRWLGQGFRERERIARKAARWKAKLLAMPPQERHAVMAALQAVCEETTK